MIGDWKILHRKQSVLIKPEDSARLSLDPLSRVRSGNETRTHLEPKIHVKISLIWGRDCMYTCTCTCMYLGFVQLPILAHVANVLM